jgi:hypothetical protein
MQPYNGSQTPPNHPLSLIVTAAPCVSTGSRGRNSNPPLHSSVPNIQHPAVRYIPLPHPRYNCHAIRLILTRYKGPNSDKWTKGTRLNPLSGQRLRSPFSWVFKVSLILIRRSITELLNTIHRWVFRKYKLQNKYKMFPWMLQYKN